MSPPALFAAVAFSILSLSAAHAPAQPIPLNARQAGAPMRAGRSSASTWACASFTN